MPHKDPEAKRAYMRRYNAANRERASEYRKANREKINEVARNRRAADPEKVNAGKRAWYADHAEELRETGRQRHAANRDGINAARRARYAASDSEERSASRRAKYPASERTANLRRKAENGDDLRRQAREKYWADPDAMRASIRSKAMRLRHGPGLTEWFAATWDEQDGLCYLCGDPLIPKWAFVDHDHRCCPSKKSCAWCRRGLACNRCNALIGLADDDPDRLRRIADNLEVMLETTGLRLALKPEQAALP